MNEMIEQFKKIVIENCSSETFKYREWFVKDHLLIVEQLANELCALYPEADKDCVNTLVWFHDFGKPLDEEREREVTRTEGVKVLKDIGFTNNFIEKVLNMWELMEKKNEIDISKQPIEVQIISSADGGAHFVGKFFSSYFRDDPMETLVSIEDRIRKKIRKDWERKIVLPEIRNAFEQRYKRALEIVGEYPDQLI